MKQMTIAVVVLALAGTVMAQPAESGNPMRMPMTVQGTQSTTNMPQLSAEQMDKVNAQRISYLKTVGPIQTDLQIKQMELAQMWQGDNLDAKKVAAKVSEINTLRSRLETARFDNMLALYNIYTPEQRKVHRFGPGGMMGGMMQQCPMMGGEMGMMSCPMMGGGMGMGMMGGGMMQGCPMMQGGMMGAH